jgi:peroxiredoxin Q/BCP
MAELKEGQKAPDFSLDSTEGKKISLKDYKGKKNVVLYFYPKDMTPGCTTEACSFRDNLARVQKGDAVVLGVSTDDLKSHDKFIKKHQLNFPLLADTEKEVVNAYGVWKKKSMYGREYMGIERSTFIIDKEGKIVYIDKAVNAPEDSKNTLQKIKELISQK